MGGKYWALWHIYETGQKNTAEPLPKAGGRGILGWKTSTVSLPICHFISKRSIPVKNLGYYNGKIGLIEEMHPGRRRLYGDAA